MDLTQAGIGLSIVGSGLTLTVLLPMKPKTKKVVGGVGIVMLVFGFGVLGYGLINSVGSQQVGIPVSQTMTDSPGGVQIQGDGNTVNQGPQSRKLTPEQEALFVQVLRNSPRGHVNLSCIESSGPEPCDFARQLKELLESVDVGWTVTYSPIIFGAGDPSKTIPSLYLEAQSESPPLFAFSLNEALKAVGYEPVRFVKADQPPDFLQLTVWHNHQKPTVDQ